MQAVERILLKIIIIQFIFLVFSQYIFHYVDAFPQLKQITKYEGVGKNIYIKMVETFSGN